MDAVEARAERVLASVPDWIWNGESLPVPIEAIADTEFGLFVRDVEDMQSAPGAPVLTGGQSISGLLFASRGEIWVSALEAREWPTRRRFTIGHELGHWVMHRGRQQSLFCRKSSVDPSQLEMDERPELPVTEQEANVFSATLLMPAHLIGEHYEKCRKDDDCFEQMCKIFGSSGAAMSRRLRAVIQPPEATS